MVLENLQEQTIIIPFSHLNTNQTVYMEAINCVLILFEENINTVDPTGLKLYPQATK